MNRWTASKAPAAVIPSSGFLLLSLLVLGLLPGCRDEEPVDARQALVDLAMEASEEARGLFGAGNSQAAQETFHRAYRHALDAAQVEGEPSMPDLLNLLSELCIQLGRWSPDYLGKAVRYSHMAIESGPGWGVPYINLGLVYEKAGLFGEAVRAYERFLELVPPEHLRPGSDDPLVRVLFREASEILRGDLIGSEGEARVVLEKAFALRPREASAPQVHLLLSRLNESHAKEIKAAADAGDGLEIARVHSRFGYPVPAETALLEYMNSSGSNREVRFVEARFVRELAGNEENLVKAAEIYLDLMARGDLVVHAAAGYGRVMLALGEGEKALTRLGDFPNPTTELRRVLILLHLDRISRTPADEGEAAAVEFAQVEELMTGGLEVFQRARLFWLTGVSALSRGDADGLEKIIGRYQKRFPQDPRVIVLGAELLKLRGIPVDDVFAEDLND